MDQWGGSYLNWPEPNNFNNGHGSTPDEDYVHLMYLDGRGKGVWNDAPNGPVRSFGPHMLTRELPGPLSYFSVSDLTIEEGKERSPLAVLAEHKAIMS